MEGLELLAGVNADFSLDTTGIQGPPVAEEEMDINELRLPAITTEIPIAVANELCPQHQFPACPIPSYILKIPPRKAASAAPDPAPTPAESGVSLEFLRAFLRRVPGGTLGGATVERVIEELIRPSTNATLSSYASQPFLVPRSHLAAPHWLVIYPPDTPLPDLVAALEELAAGLPPAGTYFWLRALAVSQHLLGSAAALAPLSEGAGEAAVEEPLEDGGGETAAAAAIGGEAGDGVSRGITPVQSFGTMLRKRQTVIAARQRATVRAARLGVLAATRAAVAAARCGAVLVVGRDARPLRRGWCLVEAAEMLRAKGPEALTVLPLDRAFTRGDLVRQLRELNVAEVVAEADEYDREVLAEALGVPPPLSPQAAEAATAGTSNPTGSNNSGIAASTAATASTSSLLRRSSTADLPSPSPRRSQPHTLSSLRRQSRASGSGTGGAPEAEVDDGCRGGRALARQLQVALLLRPMDGALPARMMGCPLGDANPVASLSSTAVATAAAAADATGTFSSPSVTTSAAVAAATAAPAANSSAASTFASSGGGGGGASPCRFDWLWDWTPLTSWLALPPEHPGWPALLITGTHGSGKTTAMAALLARLAAVTSPAHGPSSAAAAAPPQPLPVACHFCTAADARSLVAAEVVRSLSYQLSCRSPGFGAELSRSLLELGGAGGGLGLTPDGWLQGLEEVVAALLRTPLERDAEARVARGERPLTYLLLIDGLDEGPASAASGTALLDTFAPAEEDTGPPSCPGPYEVLRLLVDHLRHLPGVRLLLSCTEATPAGADGGSAGAAAAAAAAARAAAAPRPPYDLPPPLIVAPRVAADASASVHLAVRRALRPTEVPLGALRRDRHLPLALAHSLQEYVLSPELTARELLWQARGCLAHVHILQLLVRHAAEGLGPAAAMPDGAAVAAVATAANAAAAAAVAASGSVAAAPAAGPAGEVIPAPPLQQQQPPAAAPSAAAQQQQEQQPVAEPQPQSHDMPPRPKTPPRQDQAGLVRQQSQRQASRQGVGSAEKKPSPPEAAAAAAPAADLPDAAATSTLPSPPPPPELAAAAAPNTGDGAVGVHVIPPACRGSLADEYGVLWQVRTADLQEAAAIAIVRDAETVVAEAQAAEPRRPSPGRRGRSPNRLDTMTMALAAPSPLPLPYPPERAARLQLLVDVLAAAQEPLEWALLVRVIQMAEVPAAIAPAAGATPLLAASRSSLAGPSPSPSPPVPDTSMSNSGARNPASRRQSTPLAARSDDGRRGSTPGRAPSRGPEDDEGRGNGAGSRGGGGADGGRSSISPMHGRASAVRPSRDTAAAAVGAVRDLEWALQEGPLAGLVWISGCGKVSVRHSSFLDWLRRANGAVTAAVAVQGPPTTAAAAAVAAAGAAAMAAAPGTLGVPRAQRGHAALALLLRQQLVSGRLAATKVTAMVSGQRRPGSASHLFRYSMEAATPSAVLGSGRQTPLAVGLGMGMGILDGSGGGAVGAIGRRREGLPPASAYCLRHVVTHCAEGRLPATELEALLLDLDFWRQVLAGCHLEMVAASLEHLLRTRGPHARRPTTPQHQTPVAQLQQQQLLLPGLQPRTPPAAGGAAALVRGALPLAAPQPSSGNSNGGGGDDAATDGGAATAAAAAAAAAVRAREARVAAPAPLPTATSSLLRDAVLWLLQDGRSLMRRPEALTLACSASLTPLQSPFRRLTEHLTAAAAAAVAAAIADSLFLPPPMLPKTPSSPPGTTSAAGGAVPGALVPQALPSAAAEAAAEPLLFPPSFVTAMPHPRFRSPVLRSAECPHRVTELWAGPDGELVLARGESSLQASLIDTLSGRRSILLHAGAGAHHSALAAATFAPRRPLLATAGSSPGAVTLWDLTTGAPRAQLHMRRDRDDGKLDLALVARTGGAGASPFAAAAATAGAAVASGAMPLTSPLASAISVVVQAGPAEAAPLPFLAAATPSRPSTSASAAAAPPMRSSVVAAVMTTPRGSEASPASPLPSLPQPPQPNDSNDTWVTCIAIYEPGPTASATAYGAPPGARVVPSSAAAAAAAAAGDMVIVRGSALVAAGESSSGRVVMWAVAPDGWGARRTADLAPPAGVLECRGGGGVSWLGFLPGGKSLLVAQSCSTTLRVWNVQSHNMTATLRLPAVCGEVFGVHIAPQLATDADGAADTLLAAVCTSATELWALERRHRVASLPAGAGAAGGRAWADSCVAFSPAGGLLATAGAICSPPASSPVAGRPPPPVAAAAVTASQPLVHDPCAATLWDARSGALVAELRGLRGPVRALAFSPDGALLATAAAEVAEVALWSAATGACLTVLPLGEEVTDVPAVVFGRRGAVLMAAGGSGVYTWDVQLAVAAAAADAVIATVAAAGGCGPAGGSAGPAGALAPRSRSPFGGFSGGGAAATAATTAAGRRGTTVLTQTVGHADRVASVCFSPDGTMALSGGDDNTIRLWDVVRHIELVAVEQPGAVLSVAWSPDASMVAAGLSNGTAHVWHLPPAAAASAAAAAALGDFTTREAARLRCGAPDGIDGADGDGGYSDSCSTTMDAVGFSSDGKMLFTADGEGRVTVWSVKDWQQVGTAEPSVRPSRTAMARVIAAGGDGDGDGLASSSSVGLVGRFAGAAFTPDGRWVLMGCGREVMLWSVLSKREAAERLGPHGAPVAVVAASPCGKLAAVGAGSSVTIWGRPEANGGGAEGAASRSGVSFRAEPADEAGGPPPPFSPRVTLLPALAEVTGLAFSADGSLLAASLGDGSLRVWDTGRWRELGWLSGHGGGAAACVAFSPDGAVLLSGGADCRCLAWSTRDVLAAPSGSISGSGSLEGA